MRMSFPLSFTVPSLNSRLSLFTMIYLNFWKCNTVFLIPKKDEPSNFYHIYFSSLTITFNTTNQSLLPCFHNSRSSAELLPYIAHQCAPELMKSSDSRVVALNNSKLFDNVAFKIAYQFHLLFIPRISSFL